MMRREFILRILTIVLFVVGVGQLAVSEIHIVASTKVFANQIGLYLFMFIIFGLTTGFNALLIEKPRSIASLIISGVLASWGGLIFLRLLQADVAQQEQLTMADVGQSFQMVSVSIVIYLAGSIAVSFLSWPDVKAAIALESPVPH